MSDSDNDNGEQDSKDEGGTILDDGGIDTDERAGRSLGIEPGKEPDEDTKKDIEETRAERLDPDNRPENAEVDNTERTFDVERGMYTDSEDYDENEPAPFADPENPNTGDEAGDADTDGSDDDADTDDDDSGDSDDSDDSDQDQDQNQTDDDADDKDS
jgi:hypothetical protein